ncbi:gamma-crystallin M2-like [Seriola aureovittata]|uniref:gamma-crystallin M2-like n=1 Tax=Seriola aureovittata TaxID=2871759 RepID=UPI0024BDAF72|nr:gamma-crystallin M2-like [Seriola aureovittata]
MNMEDYSVFVISYEDRNFQGRFHECNNDSSELHVHFSRCSSIRVEGGFWVIHERPNYMGYQYVLSPRQYPDYTTFNMKQHHEDHEIDGQCPWIFYELPTCRGNQFLLERSEYRRYSEWGGMQPSVGSVHRVKEH